MDSETRLLFEFSGQRTFTIIFTVFIELAYSTSSCLFQGRMVRKTSPSAPVTCQSCLSLSIAGGFVLERAVDR